MPAQGLLFTNRAVLALDPDTGLFTFLFVGDGIHARGKGRLAHSMSLKPMAFLLLRHRVFLWIVGRGYGPQRKVGAVAALGGKRGGKTLLTILGTVLFLGGDGGGHDGKGKGE